MATRTDKIESIPLSAEDRRSQAECIIKRYTYWSMGAGAVPVPLVDLVGVGGAQLKMICELSKIYGVKFSEHAAQNIVSALIGTLGARVITAGIVSSMIKTLPFAGALIGGVVAMPAIAGATTFAVGRVFVEHFEAGGTLLNFSVEKMKGLFNKCFKQGKKVATEGKTAAAA